jgi:hypothetical protein
VMLMNFETKYKYYFNSQLLSFRIFFANIVLTTYSLKQDVETTR